MKKIVLIITTLILLSCSKPIEKQYKTQSEFQDLNKIKNNSTRNDYKTIKWQLNYLKSQNINIKKTYAEILSEGQIRWNDTLKKQKDEYRKVQERIKQKQEESKKEQIASISNRKWGIYFYKPNYIEVNPELSKENKELAESAFKWNPKNNWILFNENGTCKIKDEESNKVYTKKWHLNDKGEIILPTGWQYEELTMLMPKITFQIIDLNDENLNVTEVEKSTNITLSSEMKMIKIE